MEAASSRLMTPEACRLAALAALFAPDRAVALLTLVAGPEAAELANGAAALLVLERDARLRALESALAGPAPADRRARAAALAAAERPAIAAALLAAGGAAALAGPVAPLLARRIRERLSA
jgi:hypothetical protein